MNQLNKATRQAFCDIICSFLDEPIKRNDRRRMGTLRMRINVTGSGFGCVYIQAVHGGKIMQRYRMSEGNWISTGRGVLSVFDQLCMKVPENLRNDTETLREKFISAQDYSLRLTHPQLSNFRIKGDKAERSARMLMHAALYYIMW